MIANHLHARLKQKIDNYIPHEHVTKLIRATPILLLVGVSGAGKGTIKDELIKRGGYHYIISHTTRLPRANNGTMEKHGVDYHFVTHEQSEVMLDAGHYIEAKQYGENIYGTSVSEIAVARSAGEIAVADIEVQGVDVYMAIDPNVKAVFIVPPDYKTWQQRWQLRAGAMLDSDDYKKRMTTALYELNHALETPYFIFVINDNLDAAVKEINHIAHGGTATTEEAVARSAAQAIAADLEAMLVTV